MKRDKELFIYTYSNPFDRDDKRQLYTFVWDTNLGWIGTKFETEKECKRWANKYSKLIKCNDESVLLKEYITFNQHKC